MMSNEVFELFSRSRQCIVEFESEQEQASNEVSARKLCGSCRIFI